MGGASPIAKDPAVAQVRPNAFPPRRRYLLAAQKERIEEGQAETGASEGRFLFIVTQPGTQLLPIFPPRHYNAIFSARQCAEDNVPKMKPRPRTAEGRSSSRRQRKKRQSKQGRSRYRKSESRISTACYKQRAITMPATVPLTTLTQYFSLGLPSPRKSICQRMEMGLMLLWKLLP